MYMTVYPATPFVYPPPLNSTFTVAFWGSLLREYDSGKSESKNTDKFLQATVYDLPLLETGFGSEGVELHVGDVIETNWEGGANYTVSLSCAVCSLGKDGAGVWGACENCKDILHRSFVHGFCHRYLLLF